MKRYKTSENLTDGDLVECGIDAVPMKAVLFDKSRPCLMQCDLAYTPYHASCSGYCYRWANGEDFVFVNADLDGMKSVTFVETPISRQYREENKIY